MLDKALAYAQTHRPEAVSGLQELLRIPSISLLSRHDADVQHAASWLDDKLTAMGLHHVDVMATGGHPVVYADWLEAGPNAPTLLIYGHYDVQPVDPLDQWQTPPFEPTLRGDDLYGRGTADDKGQLYAHLMAVEAYLGSDGRLPLNIKFILEGEEEMGSRHLGDFVSAQRDLLRTDAALISDSAMINSKTPAVITGVRGMVYMEITLRGSRQDLHSGTYGGVVENPLNAMVKLLTALHDENGRVTIPGFYDAVRELTSLEREAIDSGVITDETILAETGAPALWGEAGYSVAERKGIRPTLDIHGIRGGFIDQGAKTVIPAAVTAKVSMRLVPDQDPHDIIRLFTDAIGQLSPKTMEVSVENLAAAQPAVVDISAPALEAAAEAYERGFGRRPVYLREGGTLPIVAMINNVLKAPVVLMGFGLPDDNLHAPNEKFHLPNFYRGTETAIHYYDIFARK